MCSALSRLKIISVDVGIIIRFEHLGIAGLAAL
jgi:hypothetical protein